MSKDYESALPSAPGEAVPEAAFTSVERSDQHLGGGDEFLKAFFGGNADSGEYEVGLDIDNVYVVFDGDGQLALIARFFVSQQ